MKEIQFDQGEDIITEFQKCTKIFFVYEGEIEIVIYNKKDECCQLEVLR